LKFFNKKKRRGTALLVGFVALIITRGRRAILIFGPLAFIRLWRVFGSVRAGLPTIPALFVRTPARSAFSFSFAQMITPYRIQSVVTRKTSRR
jgi:hypothetical protein